MRIADDIDICESGNAERVAQSTTVGTLDVKIEFRVLVWRVSEIQGTDVGRGVLGMSTQAVYARVLGRKRRVILEDDVVLSGNPVALALSVWEKRDRGIFGCVRLLVYVGSGRGRMLFLS